VVANDDFTKGSDDEASEQLDKELIDLSYCNLKSSEATPRE
jgi:hypothetical protein